MGARRERQEGGIRECVLVMCSVCREGMEMKQNQSKMK